MIRRIRHLMPSISTAASKVTQLLLLSAVSYVYLGDRADEMLVSYLLVSSFVQLSDSGAIGYLLVHRELSTNSHAVRRVLAIQTLTVGVGLIAGLACSVVFVGVRDLDLILVLVALALAQLGDGLARIVRSVFLIRHEPMAFAIPEFVVATVRALIMIAAIFSGAPLLLLLSCVPSVANFFYSWWSVSKIFAPNVEGIVVKMRSVLLFGVSGSVSALYSQSPIMIASILLSPAVAAPLAVGYRIAQAAEFVPATFAQQLLPRIAENKSRSMRRVLMFAGLGAVVAGMIWLFRDALAVFIAFPPGTEIVLLVLILSLPFKFANHFLISLTMAMHLLKARTLITGILAVISVGVSVLVCLAVGTSLAMAITAACVEIVLTLGLLALVHWGSDAFRTKRGHGQNEEARVGTSPSI